MCLATPGKLVDVTGETGVIEVHGNRIDISTVLTPEARIGDWVLVHAGFSISKIEGDEARSMWDYARGSLSEEAGEEVSGDEGVGRGASP